jgi:hypothetical protein
MAKRKPKARGGNRSTIFGIIALAGLILVILGGFGYFKWVASQRIALDQKTNCPVTGPTTATAVLLDLTDTISATTLQDLRNRFEAAIDEVPRGGLIAIYGLTVSTGKLDELYSACNPGDGTDVDPLTSNPRLARERWEDGYRQPLEKLMNGIGGGASASRSPIMAGIQKIKLTFFDSPENKFLKKNLVIVSDMIEHTDVYSQYQSGFDYSDYERSPARDMFRTSLADVSTKIFYISRAKAPSKSPIILEFWKIWFDNREVPNLEISRLEGLN